MKYGTERKPQTAAQSSEVRNVFYDEVEKLRTTVIEAIKAFAEVAPRIRTEIEVPVGEADNGSEDVVLLVWKKLDARFWVFVGEDVFAEKAPIHVLIEIPTALGKLLAEAREQQERQIARVRKAQDAARAFRVSLDGVEKIRGAA